MEAFEKVSGGPPGSQVCLRLCCALNPVYLDCGWLAMNCAVELPCARAAGEAGGVLWNLNSLGLGVPERSLDTVKSEVSMCGGEVGTPDEQNSCCVPLLLFLAGTKGR